MLRPMALASVYFGWIFMKLCAGDGGFYCFGKKRASALARERTMFEKPLRCLIFVLNEIRWRGWQ